MNIILKIDYWGLKNKIIKNIQNIQNIKTKKLKNKILTSCIFIF